MTSYRAIVPRAFDGLRRLAANQSRLAHLALACGISVTTFMSALGPTSPAHAEPPPDPVARLQMYVHRTHVYDDRDWIGSGEMFLRVVLCPDTGSGRCGSEKLHDSSFIIDSHSGENVILERPVLGVIGDTSSNITPEAGLAVYAGERFLLEWSAGDTDAFSDDDMGHFVVPVNQENGWGVTEYAVRSQRNNGSPADFSVTFDILRTRLPNLFNRGIHIDDSSGQPSYCVTIFNMGEPSSGLVPLTVRAEGASIEETLLPALDVSQSEEHCVPRSALPATEHHLSFMVDEGRQVPEMSESDNFYMWKKVGVRCMDAR